MAEHEHRWAVLTQVCGTCNGAGALYVGTTLPAHPGATDTVVCPECDGDGWIIYTNGDERFCADCGAKAVTR